MPNALTVHGEMLEAARMARGLSQRRAAAAARVSEGWWRQVVQGVQKRGGVEVPVAPSAATLAAMAAAVGADVGAVFDAAGLDRPAPAVTAPPAPGLLDELRQAHQLLADAIARLELDAAANAQPGSGEGGRDGAEYERRLAERRSRRNELKAQR